VHTEPEELPAALPSEALAPGAPTWTGCFPTAEGKPANVPTFIKIKKPSNWTFYQVYDQQ
jgi:hypothetical protein